MPKKKLEKRQPAFEDDTSIFPCDILFSIIIRLPVKSLLSFQSVSKPWRAMISDSEFKKSHRNQSKALGYEKILLGRKTGEFEFGDLENSKLVMEKQWIPLKKFQCAQVLCSCEGLTLLKNPSAHLYLVLWNPSTREYRTLRCPYREGARNEMVVPIACGLRYDSRVDDYKVIIMMCRSFYGVYSLNSNSWSEKKVFPFPAKSFCVCSPLISIEGRVFWSFHDNSASPYVDQTSTIIYFDIKSVEVKELPIPDFVGEDEIFQFLTLRNCLYLYGGKITDKESNIWIMEQDGRWKWLMNVCYLPTICRGFVQDMKLLCCTNDGEVVFQGMSCHLLFIYNPKRQQFVTISVRKHVPPPIASTCLDSLYFSTSKVRRKRKQRSLTPNNQTPQ